MTTFGERLQEAREAAGLTRAVLGGLVGRSPEWVKGVERGRLGMPRLPLLLSLAEVLQVELLELTGDERVSTATYSRGHHQALGEVREALTGYRLRADRDPEPVDALTARVAAAWRLWHATRDHRTRVAELLPGLVADVRHASRAHEGADCRRALVLAAQVHHLAQLYLAWQPVPELVYLTADRAMHAAEAADSPRALAVATWYTAHVGRAAGDRHEAQIALSMDALALLRARSDDPEDITRLGLLHLSAALSAARLGREGDAWHHWDRAMHAAEALGDVAHPWLVFSRALVAAYAVTIHADLRQPGRAIEAAQRLDTDAIPSTTRRAFHVVEAARAYSMRRDDIASAALLRQAHQISPETTAFSVFARSRVAELATTGAPMVRDDARQLAAAMGVIAAAA